MLNNIQISIITPVYNEELNIYFFYSELKTVLEKLSYDFEIIFINDGSKDRSSLMIEQLKQQDPRIILLDFSRNFGKEIAISAGLHHCNGDAAIVIDSDLQHPIYLIPTFLEKWKAGAEIVIGVRSKNKKEGMIKRIGSDLFYRLIRRVSSIEIIPYSTDYRLLDASVIKAFKRFTERGRITRGLIDWLGFKRDYIVFEASERANGKASYSFWKLVQLAVNSMVSLSFFPLKLVGYLGFVIILTFGPFGLYVYIGKYILHTKFASSFSGSAQLALLIIFMVGIIMSALGLITLYIASIHSEVINRPLYVLRKNHKNIE